MKNAISSLRAGNDGWLQDVWYNSPFPWLYTPGQFSLLCVVIPGAIAGDHLLRWMRAPKGIALAVPKVARPSPCSSFARVAFSS
ncbi:MAG: hypothetical protein H0W63_08355 [Gemmatimonadaceae bacterium]|nr:hypothetical protein [Gemmatimonadaceae bacterium]